LIQAGSHSDFWEVPNNSKISSPSPQPSPPGGEGDAFRFGGKKTTVAGGLSRNHFKTYFFVILNEVKDLNFLKKQASRRSE
jgi:hypothetical protein